MNLKLSGLVLPVVLAANAAAVVRHVSPISPRINPLVGLPKTLPSPFSGPLAGRGVTLPSPLMTPTVPLSPALSAPAVLPVAGYAVAAPAPARALAPAARVLAPAPALLPESALLLAAADSKKPAPLAPAPAAPARAADELRNLFDGSRKPSDIAWEPILPRDRQPVPARRHGLPEDELERELGVDPNF